MTQRLFPRIRTAVPVVFDCGGAPVRGRMENASLRGMRIVAGAPQPPSLGQSLAVDVELPGGRATRVSCRVVFIEPSPADGTIAFAVELTHPNEEYAAMIGLLVAATVRKGAYRT